MAKLPKSDFLKTGADFFSIILGNDFSNKNHDTTLSVEKFLERFKGKYQKNTAREKDEELMQKHVKKVHFSLVIDKTDLANLASKNGINYESEDESLWSNFFFLIVKTKEQKEKLHKSVYARITRIINRRMGSPAVILLCAAGTNEVSLSLVERRANKIQKERDVIGKKVSMLYAINCQSPHRADLELLNDLNIVNLIKSIDLSHDNKYFDAIVQTWLREMSIEKLNKKFYKELSAWFSQAVKDNKVKFPSKHFYHSIEAGKEVTKNREVKKEEQLIRLIIRLIFVWFIKEKGFIPPDFFEYAKVFSKESGSKDSPSILASIYDPERDDYYRAVLQNLFFATLNTEITGKENYQKRGFSKKNNSDHRNFNKWRYKDEIKSPEKFSQLMNKIPFMNGGLFDCLDSFEASTNENKKGFRLDCFTDNPRQRESLCVPNRLFFGDQGIIEIFNRYKFTLEEDTPLDIDVALDPELLGLTFENLLAFYNEETKEMARKVSGSFYTPRHIVHFMVVESLKEYFRSKLLDTSEEEVDALLSYLFDTEENMDGEPSEDKKRSVIAAINELKILDPVVGSGAFPMEILNTCVNLLMKLDPQNSIWRQMQIENITEYKQLQVDKQTTGNILDRHVREEAQRVIKVKQEQIENDFKKNSSRYSRKLYLIRNSIFGVDIQSIAVQVARLRFFISLAIEQNMGSSPNDNYGINPLPNLETNFIAADALIHFEEITSNVTSSGMDLIKGASVFNLSTVSWEKHEKIQEIRDRVFSAKSRLEKLSLLKREREGRIKLGNLIKEELRPRGANVANDYNSKSRAKLLQVVDKWLSWDFADQNMAAEWFDPRIMFYIDRKFDIVIANPPYIQLQKEEGRLGKKYEKQGYDSFAKTGDIYALFYERGISLLKEKGILTFITSNKWMMAKYGDKLRKFLVDKTSPTFIIDLGKGVFDSATVATNILLTSNHKSEKRTLLGATICKNKKSLEELGFEELGGVLKEADEIPLPEGNSQWIITSDLERGILSKVKEKGKSLIHHDIKINRAITTGKNEAFLLSTEDKEKIISEDKKSAELIKPVLQGRDIIRWQVKSSRWIITTLPVLNLNIDEYPGIKKHLLAYGKENLEQSGPPGRSSNKYKWFETQVPAIYFKDFEKEKVIYSTIASSGPKFYLDTKGYYYGVDSTFIMTGDPIRYLIAFLNSPITHSIFANFFTLRMAADRAPAYKRVYLENLPIPKIEDKEEKKKFTDLVAQIVALNSNGGAPTDVKNKIDSIQEEIDILVAKAYALTQKEVDYLLDLTTPPPPPRKLIIILVREYSQESVRTETEWNTSPPIFQPQAPRVLTVLYH